MTSLSCSQTWSRSSTSRTESEGVHVALPEVVDDVLDPGTTALLLWDLQQGLGGQSPQLDELSVMWRDLYDAAVASGVLIVRSRHLAPRPDLMDDVTRWRITRRTHGENRPDNYMQPGGQDTAWIPGWEPTPDELVIEKSAPSLFHLTQADARLRARGIRTLVLAGVATEQGIDFTSRHAQAHGYFTVVVEDAVGSYSAEAHEHGIALLRRATFVCPTAKITERWGAASRVQGAR
jgi:nicotinamidase-related amidase